MENKKMLFEAMLEAEELKISAKLSNEEILELRDAANDRKIVGFLVDQYYQSQEYRKAVQNQARSLLQGYDQSREDHPEFIKTLLLNVTKQEARNKAMMDVITEEIPICRWMKSIKGIGPVISAYLYSALVVNVWEEVDLNDIPDYVDIAGITEWTRKTQYEISSYCRFRGKFYRANQTTYSMPGTIRYGTDFSSYTGLNDNNNPWLGEKGAAEVMKKALAKREAFYGTIDSTLESFIPAAKMKKVKTKVKSYIKTLGIFDLVDLGKIIQDTTGIVADLSDLLTQTQVIYLEDWAKWIENEKNVDQYLYDTVHEITGRKVELIEQGTINTWMSKKKKPKKPTTEELKSYLSKPPYNKDLKKLMFNIGDCFIKNSSRGSLYGEIFRKRLDDEMVKNEALEYADQAAKILETKNIQDTATKKTLQSGKLTQGHLVARARRYAVKLFISHVHEAMWCAEFHEDSPSPYVISHMGHKDYVAPEVDYHEYL